MELKRTTDLYTLGIVNLPVERDASGKPVYVEEAITGKKILKVDRSSRYLFFELDDYTDNGAFQTVANLYKEYHLPVYIHRSMRGFHFLSVQPVKVEAYHEMMKQIKHLNPKCPHVTIRIIPNKWQGEQELWNDGFIMSEIFHKPSANLREMMLRNQIEKLKANYRIVTYKQSGDKGDL